MPIADLEPRLWPVGALVRAVADALAARFNPVLVRGEVSGFARAASGHCYFTLKDATGQLRCAMFRRAAEQLPAPPREGELVEVEARLSVYEPRGDLQLVVERLTRAGQGALYERFLRIKARLEAEGLFDAARKRPLPKHVRTLGLVTSLGAAALHDVATALARRAPQVSVLLAPAQVQGPQAPEQLLAALRRLAEGEPPPDAILLVRGGGSLEDLWAFNDEALARAIALSPVPVVTGIGHETDFTIADFVADLRAPTPTAAAELVAPPRDQLVAVLDAHEARLNFLTRRFLEGADQTLDGVQARLGRPSARLVDQHRGLDTLASRLSRQTDAALERSRTAAREGEQRWNMAWNRQADARRERLARAEDRLALLSPRRVLERGYALLTDPAGDVVSSVEVVRAGQDATALLADGALELSVTGVRDRSIVDALLQ